MSLIMEWPQRLAELSELFGDIYSFNWLETMVAECYD